MVVFSQVIPAGISTRVLARNSNRAVFTIGNFSGYDCYLGHDQNVKDTGSDMGFKIVNGSTAEDEFKKGEVWVYMATSGTITIEETNKGD